MGTYKARDGGGCLGQNLFLVFLSATLGGSHPSSSEAARLGCARICCLPSFWD